MPAKETPAEEMPRRGVDCGRLSGRAERRLHLHYSNAAVCIEVLTLVLLRIVLSETNLAETRKDRLDVLTDMLAHARISARPGAEIYRGREPLPWVSRRPSNF
jgi:hypothetical protein